MWYTNLSQVLFLTDIINIPEKKMLKQKGRAPSLRNNCKVSPITLTYQRCNRISVHLIGSDEPCWSKNRIFLIFIPAAIHEKRFSFTK